MHARSAARAPPHTHHFTHFFLSLLCLLLLNARAVLALFSPHCLIVCTLWLSPQISPGFVFGRISKITKRVVMVFVLHVWSTRTRGTDVLFLSHRPTSVETRMLTSVSLFICILWFCVPVSLCLCFDISHSFSLSLLYFMLCSRNSPLESLGAPSRGMSIGIASVTVCSPQLKLL